MQSRTPMRTQRPRVPFRLQGRRTRLGAVFCLFIAAVSALSSVVASPVSAQGDDPADNASQVRIIEVSGLIDPVIGDFLLQELDAAEADDVLAVVLQMDSKGSVLSDSAFAELARRLDSSPIPVAIWVGPSGSVAFGGSAELLSVADVRGVAAGSRIGELERLRLDDPAPFGEVTQRLLDQSINADEAIELELSVGPLETSSVLRQFVNEIPGFEGATPESTTAEGLSQPQFRQLPLTLQLFHTVASPEVAYLFFVGGMALLVFELFTAGVGIAGAIGAFLLVMGCYGVAVLPTRTSAVVCLVLAQLAFAVDIQTNIPRIYSGVGMVLFAIGTLTLYDGVSMSVITIGVGLIGAALYAYTGMPSMVRTRFSSPTIGRSWIIGELGEATSDIDPEGTVRVKDAPWRAITNRATPLKSGEPIRVVGIDRMLLEVAPLEGAAKDYRDRG